ncbi:BNR repeat-containing protein [Aquihabitans sp. G128]|uniref:BNR-4 repeat-containing protein n=1 Tax=Aquihabitans sp. G128 TaxID=2849779 RepID=UPI001C226F3E|nr:BNR-4 repeat-containing protein [Aquihabitans sp. G128]QXC60871.1 BNR repeat-containing protein [Aquihabitans sp. G128]
MVTGGHLYVGSVPDPGILRAGPQRSEVLVVDLGDLSSRSITLGTSAHRPDDHDSPGLTVDPDGSVTASWTGHDDDGLVHLARTAGEPVRWQRLPDVAFPPQPGLPRVTYANLVRSQGLLWNFTRLNGRTVAMSSADEGRTWSSAPLLGLPVAEGTAPDTPYVQYAANPTRDRIDFVTSTGHPKGIVRNALHSGYVQGAGIFRTDGTQVGTLRAGGPGVDPSALTPVDVPDGPAANDAASPYGQPDLWGSDLRIDADGNPVVTYSLRTTDPSPVEGKRFRHQYRWARWSDEGWERHTIGEAGSELFGAELDYTGLATLDPRDPYRVVVSSDVDPSSGQPLVSSADGAVHRELFDGRSADGGRTWTWRPLTKDSTADNIRPILVAGDDGTTVIVWQRGAYRSWLHRSMAAMVAIERP